MQKNSAVFLDRDGVIIKNIPYLHETRRIEFLSGVTRAIKAINNSGYKCIVVTNQSGIARGIFSIEELLFLNNYIKRSLKRDGAIIDAIYFCPHHPEGKISEYAINCNCRKPMPGLILKAAKDHNINLSKSIMIGDQEIDIQAGERAGCKSFILNKTMIIDNKEILFNRLEEAVDHILTSSRLTYTM